MSFDYLRFVTEGIDRNAVLHDLMEAYGKDVWNYAFFLTVRSDVADDIMQDVFVKVYERMNSFRGEASIRTWLFAITRNTVRDYRKSAWLRRVLLTHRMSVHSTGESAEHQVLEGLQREQVWREVLALPVKLREVLLLTAHHGLSIKEIAQLLGISEGTVKSRLFRAREKVNRTFREGEPQ